MTPEHDGAAAPGPVTPTSDNAPWQARVEGNGEADNPDCAAKANQRKRLFTLQAELALRGFELRQTDNGMFIVHRWGLSQALDSLDAVASFALRVGARHG